MAKDRRKVQHIHSSILDKQPTPATLEVGEIAVNNAEKKEFLSIKNTNDMVVRFSSDEQMITWMEKKEVMPYVGYVRGETGPSATSADTPTADAMGSYGITNNDLLNNNSEIVVKFNQVVAKNTKKYDRVNGAKDKYNKDINPTTDSGLTDGAGFFIDMSRYAMRGANPSFSSLTVTDKTDLSGNTTITDGDGTGTRSGNTFTVKVTNENETVTTLNESATTRTTLIGTENLTVSGTTTEVHTGDVTITNKANVTATTDGNEVELIKGYNYRDVNGNYSGTTGGTTTEVKTGAVSETNKDNKTVNTSGTTTYNNSGTTTTNVSANTVFNTTGTTTVKSTGSTIIETNGDSNKVTIQSTGTGGDIEVFAKDTLCASGGTTAAFVGTTKTNIGKDCADGGQTTTLNLNGTTINQTGNTINISAPTLNIDTTDFDIDATNVCISGATKANFYGATTNIGIDCGGATATTVNVSGATINNGGTTINNNVTNYNITGTTNINGNVSVTGTITATGAIYSSDRNLKENINFIEREDINKVKNIFTKSFNFKDDDSKRKVYGVIAQEVQEVGLNELVHTKDDGTLAVDYTSLLILKTAYLEDFCAMLNGRIVELENKIKELENKG